jgi:hypothetical protein
MNLLGSVDESNVRKLRKYGVFVDGGWLIAVIIVQQPSVPQLFGIELGLKLFFEEFYH